MKPSQILSKIDAQIEFLEKNVSDQALIQEHGAPRSINRSALFTQDKRDARDNKEASVKALQLLQAVRKNILESSDELLIAVLQSAENEAKVNKIKKRDAYDLISRPVEGDYDADDIMWSLRRDNIRESKVSAQGARMHAEYLQDLLTQVIHENKQPAVAEPASEAAAESSTDNAVDDVSTTLGGLRL